MLPLALPLPLAQGSSLRQGTSVRALPPASQKVRSPRRPEMASEGSQTLA
jgi:hypothetical protein